MRKLLLLIFILLLWGINSYSQENEIKYLKRNILILPLVNADKIEKYNYITDKFINNYNRLLSHHSINNFNSSSMSLADTIYDKNKVIQLAIQQQADTVIYGEYTLDLNDKKIIFKITAMDILTQEIIVELTKTGDVNFNLLRVIDQVSQDSAYQLNTYLKSYNKKLVDKLERSGNKKLEPLINQLKNQQNVFWDYMIDRKNFKQIIPVGFLQQNFIFICEETEKYSVQYEDELNDRLSKIKLFTFNEDDKKERLFVFSNGEKEVQYKYRYSPSNDIIVKLVEFSGDERLRNYSIYMDILLMGSTAGHIGIDYKIGLGLPVKTKLENSIFIKFQLAPKAINIVNYDKTDHWEWPHLKFGFGAGFDHAFYIKNRAAIHLGMEFGGEFHFYSFLIKDNEKLNLNKMIMGNPSIYIGVPFGVEFFADKRVSLIISATPTVRFVMTYFFYDNAMWLENLDETRGVGMEPMRIRVYDYLTNNDSYLTVDLFLYDMPIFVGIKLKM